MDDNVSIDSHKTTAATTGGAIGISAFASFIGLRKRDLFIRHIPSESAGRMNAFLEV